MGSWNSFPIRCEDVALILPQAVQSISAWLPSYSWSKARNVLFVLARSLTGHESSKCRPGKCYRKVSNKTAGCKAVAGGSFSFSQKCRFWKVLSRCHFIINIIEMAGKMLKVSVSYCSFYRPRREIIRLVVSVCPFVCVCSNFWYRPRSLCVCQ